MQLLICLLLPGVVLLDFFRINLGLPSAILFLPEALSALALIYVLSRLVSDRQLRMPPFYALLIAIIALHVVAGLIIAEATVGPIVGGLRLYLKYLPFFFLPMVHRFSTAELRTQMLIMAGLIAIQLPVTAVQRFVVAPWWRKAGDIAKGTFSTGSFEAIFLLACLAVIIGLRLKKVIATPVAVGLAILAFLPTTIGDTKGVFFLLPIVTILPVLFNPSGVSVTRRAGRATLLLVIAIGGYLAVAETVSSAYNSREGTLTEFFFDYDRLVHYLAPQLAGREAVEERHGRLDKVAAPLVEHADEPLKLIAGLGIGALNKAPIDAFSADQHAHIIVEGRVGVSMSLLLWEFGLLGTLLIMIAIARVWYDAYKLREAEGIEGALALGYVAIMPLLFGAMCWKNVIVNNGVMYCLTYFAGVVVAASFSYRRANLPNPPAMVAAAPEPSGPPPILQTAAPAQ